MKIKNKLYLILAFSIGLFLLIIISINIANNKMKAAMITSETLSEVQKNLSDLNAVTYEFLLYKEERMIAQWNISYNSTFKLSEISEETLDTLEERETINSLRSNILSMKDKFIQLNSIILKRRTLVNEGASEDEFSALDSLEARIISQLLLKSHSANLDSLMLVNLSNDVTEAVRKKTNAVVIFSLLLFTVYLTIALVLTYRGIASPLAKLIQGTEIVGAGNLDYRVEIGPQGEMCDLAVAFNLMTEKRNLAENERRDSDLRYRTVFENSKDGISIYERAETSERRLIDCNPSYVRMSGRTKDELLAVEDIRTLQATENPEFDTAAIQQKIVNNQPYWGTFSWRRPDGKENYIEYEAVPLNIGGKINLYVIDRDITARKQAEDELRRSEARLSNAQRIAHLGNWEWNLSSNTVIWSEEVFRIFGKDQENYEVKQGDFMNSVHQDDRDIVREVIDEALKGIRPYDVDYRILLPDGTLRFVHAQAEIVHDESGKPLRMSGTVQDITLQKITEKELTKLAHDLGERVKEQKCLYNISKLDEKPGISLDEIFQGVVDTIPPGWHYPDITCARIIYSGKKYKTANFQETDWKQTSGIHVQGVRIGSLTVGYLEQRPELDEGPFLKEERELIDTIAKNLGRTIERKLAQVELQKNKDNLEKTVKKRTSELEAVNEELKVNLQDIETFNKLAVGREKKMIVLKKEINELLKELGRDKKYKTTRNNRNGTQGNQRHVH